VEREGVKVERESEEMEGKWRFEVEIRFWV